jgi:hypothetical protein
MVEPAKEDSTQIEAPAHWSRLAARLSAASAFVCFTLNCVVNQLMLKNPQPGREWVWTVTDGVSMGIIGLGIVAGLLGLYGGIRKKSSDTIGIALIGLFLHGGILFVAFWLRAALKAQGG